jgi:hyperosmotically inducible protein
MTGVFVPHSGGIAADETPKPAEAGRSEASRNGKGESKTEKATDAKPQAAPKPAEVPRDPVETKPPETKPPDKAEAKTDGSSKPPIGSPILAVKLAFMADPRLLPYDINVDLKDPGVVALSGKVPSEAEKQAAGAVAQSVDGIKTVINEIDVSKDLAKTLSRRKDDIISQYVRERFGKSKTLDSARFDVKTEEGVVSLSGKTRYQVIVLEAAETARQVPGVKAVKTDGVQLEAGE